MANNDPPEWEPRGKIQTAPDLPKDGEQTIVPITAFRAALAARTKGSPQDTQP